MAPKNMTAEHKAAMAEGRREGQAVKAYLDALEQHRALDLGAHRLRCVLRPDLSQDARRLDAVAGTKRTVARAGICSGPQPVSTVRAVPMAVSRASSSVGARSLRFARSRRSVEDARQRKSISPGGDRRNHEGLWRWLFVRRCGL